MKQIRSPYVRSQLEKLGVMLPPIPTTTVQVGGSMKVETLQVDRHTAHELWRKYQEHKAYQQPHDEEIANIYKQIARGKTVIRALESIRNAGLNQDGLPNLAIARADMVECYLHHHTDAATFGERSLRGNSSRSKNVRMDWPGLAQPRERRWHYTAQVPLIPVHLRPQRGLQNYHILWEAEWTKRYPVDPYLLRRFGGDAWLVVAAWDLTDVERAVMASRLNG